MREAPAERESEEEVVVVLLGARAEVVVEVAEVKTMPQPAEVAAVVLGPAVEAPRRPRGPLEDRR